MDTKQKAFEEVIAKPMSREAWENCGKACGWKDFSPFTCGCNDIKKMPGQRRTYINHGVRFHEINLTEGFEKAVAYLQELIK